MASAATVLNFALLKLSGILSPCLLGQLKLLVWKFHKGEKRYSFLLFWRTEEEPKNKDMTLKITPTTHLGRDVSTTMVQASGSNEAKSECRSSCKGSKLQLEQRGLMMALLEFHLRCCLFAMEVVKCQSALQTPHHSSLIVKECPLTQESVVSYQIVDHNYWMTQCQRPVITVRNLHCVLLVLLLPTLTLSQPLREFQSTVRPLLPLQI